MGDNRHYSKEHAWVRDNGGGSLEIGLSGYAIKQLDGVAYVLFEAQEDKEIKAGDFIASVESRKAAGSLVSPVDGIVKALAVHIETDPSCLEDCDGDMALAVIRSWNYNPSDLMTREQYDEYCKTL